MITSITSIATGFGLGVIHVIGVGGADHWVAMAPNAMKKPKLAIRDGLAWGIGHSTGVLILASLAILAKDLVNIELLSDFAEFFVGITLLIVGALAIRSALGLDIHMHNHDHGVGEKHKHLHLHLLGRKFHGRHTHAATGLGVLHGVAGASHLLAVIPTLALPTMVAVAYMAAYLLGTMVAMAVVVIGISLATFRPGQRISPLIMGSVGGVSVSLGLFWLQKTPLPI